MERFHSSRFYLMSYSDLNLCSEEGSEAVWNLEKQQASTSTEIERRSFYNRCFNQVHDLKWSFIV